LPRHAKHFIGLEEAGLLPVHEVISVGKRSDKAPHWAAGKKWKFFRLRQGDRGLVCK
jgi:hypothetical protein